MPTLNYTTKIAATKTIGEIQAMLAAHGADAIGVVYENREPAALSFKLDTPHGPRSFTLPIDVAAMHRLLTGLRKERKIDRDQYASLEHAKRVAWRVVKDWLAAQLALIDAQMATLDQVMLPYLHVAGERTLYDVYRENEQKAIGA